MGYVGWINTFQGHANDARRGTFESEMVKELLSLGAVLYCKTSVPQTLMTGETVNNIIQYTWNPKNRFLTCGGSSGGEGALISLRGSPCGIGTDFGGSIRIPAAFNGLYGIRPSSGRLSGEGTADPIPGQNTILPVVGPLAPTAAGLKLLFHAILTREPWLQDPQVVQMPWRDAEEAKVSSIIESGGRQQLVFGVMKSDGIVNPHPPVLRAITLLTAALLKAGHKVIEWKPPSHKIIGDMSYKTWLYDGGKAIFNAFALSGERIAPQISLSYGTEAQKEFTGSQIAENNLLKYSLQKQYMDYWNSTATLTGSGRPVDGVICPIAPYAAARPETYKYYSYSTWVNAMDYTSVIVPVTLVDKNIDVYDLGYTPIGEEDRVAFEDYDASIADGAHVGVQIVGRRYTEEKMIAIAEYAGSLLA